MWLPARIATRFILASKKQSALIIIGIAVGVSIQIFIGILIQSLQASLIDRTVGSSPHIRITSENGTICSWEAMIEIAEEEEGVRVVSPVKDGYALLKNTGNNPSVLIRGMNLTEADKIYKLTRKLIAGTLAQNATVPLQNSINNTNSTSSNETETIYIEAVIGKLLAEENNLHTGDNISILTSAGATYNLTISGICNFRVSQLNRQWILIPLKAAQYIFNTGNNISSIEIQIADIFSASSTSQSIAGKIKEKGTSAGGAAQIPETESSNITVSSWQEENADLLQGLKSQSLSSYIIQVSVIVSVSIAIASVLAITVMQKSRQIGILKAMGIDNKATAYIFLNQGIMLGTAGAVIGILLGILLLEGFNAGAKNPEGEPVVPIVYNLGFIVLSGSISVLASLVASLIPAIRSAKLSPVEVIRNG